MAGITWLFLIPIVSLVVIGVLVVGTLRKNGWGINLNPVRCPSCEAPLSARRQPVFRSQALLGGWVCPHCGTKMDKWGRVGTSESPSGPL
jgi:hypothetical protein